jgi:hypothetical protein
MAAGLFAWAEEAALRLVDLSLSQLCALLIQKALFILDSIGNLPLLLAGQERLLLIIRGR